jgi:hypothetical protein
MFFVPFKKFLLVLPLFYKEEPKIPYSFFFFFGTCHNVSLSAPIILDLVMIFFFFYKHVTFVFSINLQFIMKLNLRHLYFYFHKHV